MSSEACKDKRKLLIGELVEVRQREKGLRGSWHPGVVRKVKPGRRLVEYDELLSEDGSQKLVESIAVSRALDGAKVPARLIYNASGKKERGFIRPRPPPLPEIPHDRWIRGLWIDAFYEDAWWDGVMMEDLVGSDLSCVKIYFPDEGDESSVPFTALRIAQEWDEETCMWRVKGLSDFYKDDENSGPVPVFEIPNISEDHTGVQDATQNPGHQSSDIPEDCHLSDEEVKAYDVADEAILANVPLITSEDVQLSKDISESAEEEVKAAEMYNEAIQTDLSLMSLQIEEDAAPSKHLSENADEEVKAAEMFSNAIQTNASFVLFQIDKDITPFKDISENPDGEIRATDMSSQATQANVSFISLQNDKNVAIFEDTSENGDKEIKAADMYIDAMQGDSSLKSFKNDEDDPLQDDFSEHLNETLEDVDWFKVNSEGGEPKSSQSCSEDLAFSKEISEGILTSDIRDLDMSKCMIENINFYEDNAAGMDVERPKETMEEETLAEWMELEKVRVAEMRKCSSSTFCPSLEQHFETEMDQLTGRGRGRGRCRGWGRGQGRGQSRRATDVVLELDWPMSSDRGNCSIGQFSSQTEVELVQEDIGHKENEPSSMCAKLGSNWAASGPRSIDPKVLRAARFTAKMILQKAGYTIRFRSRTGKCKEEAYYVSPEGRAFYSLLAACNYWKLHTSHPISPEESRTMQLVNMYKLTKNFVHCKSHKKKEKEEEIVFKNKSKKLKLSKSKCLYRSGRMSKSCEGDSDVLSTNRIDVASGDGPICHFRSKTAKRRLALQEYLVGSELEHKKDQLQKLTKSCKRKQRSIDLNSVPRLSKQLKGVSGSYKKGQLLKRTSSRLRSACRLEVLMSPHGLGQGDSDATQALGKKTILSWLIDMAVIQENEKVQYMSKKDGIVMLEGWVTREGILCNCCNSILRVSVFEAHAGSKLHRPSASIRVNDGRSLLDCQVEALNILKNRSKTREENALDDSDDTCGVCGDGGDLICCDHCPSTFHLMCVAVEDIPEGEWYCPNCRCTLCGGSEFNGDKDCFNELTVLLCDQCERGFHVGCLNANGLPKMDQCPKGSWFCGPECEEIFQSVRGLVGSTHALEDGFSWTLIRSTDEDDEDSGQHSIEANTECSSKLALALSVMHECFRPMIDGRTQIDTIAHVVYNRGADLNRLNFRGFYTVLLERGDELISVACIRIHGPQLAEMPLIGTRFQYRRKGMCRRLINAIEGMLENLKIATFVLPAVPDLLETWTGGFGFQLVSAAQRLQLVELNILAFPGSTLLQKTLDNSTSPLTNRCSAGGEKHCWATNHPRSLATFPQPDCQYECSAQSILISNLSSDKILDDNENDSVLQTVAKTTSSTNKIKEDLPLHAHIAQGILPRRAVFHVKNGDASQYGSGEISNPNSTDNFESSDIPNTGAKTVSNGLHSPEDMEGTVELLRCSFGFSSSKVLERDNVSLPTVPDNMYPKSLKAKLKTIKGTC